MRHAVAVKLETDISHPVLHDHPPGVIAVIIKRKYLVIEYLVKFFEIIGILLLHGHICIICFRYNKSIITMIDELRYPAIIS